MAHPQQLHQRRLLRIWRTRCAAIAAMLLLTGACSSFTAEQSGVADAAGSTGGDATGSDAAATPAGAPATTLSSNEPTSAIGVGGESAPRRGGTLHVLLAADPTPITGWTPWEHVCAWSCRSVLDHVLETLTVVLADGSVAPWLAESVSADVSLQRWTVRLREGITFTDGDPVDASTVKAGIDDFLRSGRASGGDLRDARITSVIVQDDLTLVFELSEPNAGLPAALAGPVGRVFSVTAATADLDTFARAPVGTGPFMFRHWSEGETAVLEANPSYWRTADDGSPLPRVDEIQFTVIEDERDRLATLLEGRAHVLMSRSAEQATAVGDATDSLGRPLRVIHRFDDNAGIVLFNLLRPPLDDIAVRRALIAAANPEVLVAALGSDVDRLAATQWWAPGSIWHSADVAQGWPKHDLDRAQALLREYVEDPERSDGRDRGEPVRIRVLCTDDAALARMTVVLERQWEHTGLVEVEVETLARTGLISRVTGSVVQSPSFGGDFTASCWRVGGESDPALLATLAVGPVRTTPLNAANFTGEHLPALASLIKSTNDLTDRRRAVTQFSAELNNEAPWVYLGYASSVVAASSEVGGLGRTTLPNGNVVEGHRFGVSRYDEVWLRNE